MSDEKILELNNRIDALEKNMRTLEAQIKFFLNKEDISINRDILEFKEKYAYINEEFLAQLVVDRFTNKNQEQQKVEANQDDKDNTQTEAIVQESVQQN